MVKFKFIFSLIFCFVFTGVYSTGSSELMQQGWSELEKDNDTTAFRLFEQAYEQALIEQNPENSATALLNMGICTYGVSYSQGLHYCLRALKEFEKLSGSELQKALTGRSKCLQLISTINARQGKFKEAIALSREAMLGFPSSNDSSGYLGLIFNLLGEAYGRMNMVDSSEYFHRRALEERLQTGNLIYLPVSYLKVADIELKHGNYTLSRDYYNRALAIADSTGNRQSQVSSLLGLAGWINVSGNKELSEEECLLRAKQIAAGLSDKSFYLKTLRKLQSYKKEEGKFSEALSYGEEIEGLMDTLATWERDRITKSLEVQFEVAEKDRQLDIIQNEKELTTLTNYILWGAIGFMAILGAAVVLFLKKINKRDQLLLITKGELMIVMQEQEKMKAQQMRNELEFKEGQLSALAVQMLQKNELLMELKEKLDAENGTAKDNPINRIISKGLNQDKEWADFNASFESMNKNFYSRIRQAYPDISPNELRICALIKMNLSIKEMAGILNISPDSVKTARYRLRKKLQLNSEDNLTDFILNLS